MFPRDSKNNTMNCPTAYFEFFGKVRYLAIFSFIQSSYFFYLFFCKNSSSLFFSLCRNSSFLFLSIKHVFFMGSQEQVVRPYASRIVASVAHLNSFWNFSEMNFPRYSVGFFVFFIHLKRSIGMWPISRLTSDPFPAIVKRNNCRVCPKSLFNCALHGDMLYGLS